MIQIDMPMPTNCLNCPACNEYLTCAIPVNGRKWGENDVREFGQSRPEWCPMKEQEAVEPYVTGRGETFETAETWWYACGNCHEALDVNDKYCRHCGRQVKWSVD